MPAIALLPAVPYVVAGAKTVGGAIAGFFARKAVVEVGKAAVVTGGAYVASQMSADDKANEEATPVTGTDAATCVGNCQPPPDCKDLNDKIKARRDELAKRYQEMREDKGDLFNLRPTGRMSWQGHVDQFVRKQQNLRSQLNNAESQGCKPPANAWKWATRKPPSKPAP